MTIVMAFLAIMGYVGQAVKNKQQGAQRNRRAPGERAQNENVQSEIERFLNEVTGQKKPEQRREQPARPPERRPERRPVEQRQEVTQERRPPQRRKPERRPERPAERPARRTAQRVKQPETPAAPAATPAASYSAPSVVIPPRRSTGSGVKPTTAPRSRDVVTTVGASLAKELRDPAMIRRAIVLNMILGPPKSSGKSDVLRTR